MVFAALLVIFLLAVPVFGLSVRAEGFLSWVGVAASAPVMIATGGPVGFVFVALGLLAKLLRPYHA